MYLCPRPLRQLIDQANNQRNSHTHDSQSDLMVLIIKGQSCFRKRMYDWNIIQKLPKNGDHCQTREWFDGSSEEERNEVTTNPKKQVKLNIFLSFDRSIQYEAVPSFSHAVTGMRPCYECRGLETDWEREGEGADGVADKVDNARQWRHLRLGTDLDKVSLIQRSGEIH